MSSDGGNGTGLQSHQVSTHYVLSVRSLVSNDFIRCICGAEFCYVCGERWKRCDCPRWNEDSLFAPVEQLDAPHRHNALPEIHAPGVDPVQAALEYMRNEIRTMNAAFTRIDGRLDPAGQRDAHQLQYDLPEPDQPRLDERQTLEYLRDEIQAQLAAVNRLALRG